MPAQRKKVAISTMALMTVGTVVSLNALPMMAAEGLSLIFYILFATIIFLLPAAMVSAELGSAFAAHKGGVYTWVKAAFGPRWGFVAIWMQWVQTLAWYPTILGFSAASLAYCLGDPHLAQSGLYTGMASIGIYACATAVALSGTDAVNALTKYSVFIGTLVPSLFIIVLGLLWVDQGNTIAFLEHSVRVDGHMMHEHVHPRFFPYISGLGSVTFLAGIVLMFAGVEVQSVQATAMKKPERDFPVAMLLAAAIAFIIYLLGSLAVAAVLSPQEMSLTAGLMQAFSLILHKFNLDFLVPVVALLITFGGVGNVMAWVSGPSKGILQTAREGEAPPLLGKENKAGAPVALLSIQGVIVLGLSSIYFLVENVSVAFFILTTLTASIYLAMYLLMFGAAIWLRITMPDLPRPYRVPGGFTGMFFIGGLGFLGVAFAFIVGFFPPHNLPIGNPGLYVGLVAGGLCTFLAVPLLIQAFKKPQWKLQVKAENSVSINGNNGE